MSEDIRKMIDKVKNFIQFVNKILQNKSKLIGISFDDFLKKSYKFGSDEFINNLSVDYMKKLKNRLYKIYYEINSVGKK